MLPPAALHVKTSIRGFLFRDKLKSLVKDAKQKEKALYHDASLALTTILKAPSSRYGHGNIGGLADPDGSRRPDAGSRDLMKLETYHEELGSGSYNVDAVIPSKALEPLSRTPPPARDSEGRGSRHLSPSDPNKGSFGRDRRSARAPPNVHHIMSYVEPGQPQSPSHHSWSPLVPVPPLKGEGVSLPGTVQSTDSSTNVNELVKDSSEVQEPSAEVNHLQTP